MDIRWYTSVKEFPESLIVFCEKSCDQYLFSSRSYLTAFEADVLSLRTEEAAYLAVFEQEVPITLLPLMKGRKWGLTELCSLTNYYFFRFDLYLSETVVKNPDLKERVFEVLKNELKRYRICHFVPVHDRDVNLKDFIAWLDNGEWLIEKYDYSSNWVCDLVSVDDYFGKLPSRLRNTITRSGKKMKNRDLSLKLLCDSEDIESHFKDYWKVYNKSWKVEEPYPAFIEKIVRNLGQKKQCILGLLYLESVPVSAQLWFLDKRTAYIFKLAYDPQYQKYSVGSYLTWEMIKHSVQNYRIDRIDFLNGNDTYKKDWMDKCFQVSGYFCINKSGLTGKLLSLIYRIRNYIKLVRRHRERP